MYQKISRRVASARRGNHRRLNTKDERADLLTDLLQLHKERPEFTETYLRRLAVTNFGAGHETMCAALTSVMAMIGSHPEVHKKVTEEVRDTPNVMPYDHAVRLRYTQASIKEAQRLHPVIGMSLSRKVPAGGLSLHGHYLPAGTTVGCNPAALHRNVDIFGTDADRYNPDRWLQESSTDQVRTMERNNLTWGGGSRTCPGRHLAELIVSKIVPALLKEFDVEITSMPAEDEMPCYFMAMLTGVRARFIPVGSKDSPQV